MSTVKQSSELLILFLGLKSRSRKGVFGLQVHSYSSDKISEGFFSYFTLVYKGIYMQANLLATSKALKTISPEKWDASVLAKKKSYERVSVCRMTLKCSWEGEYSDLDLYFITQTHFWFYKIVKPYMLWLCNPIVSLSLLNIFSSWYNGNRDGINDCN